MLLQQLFYSGRFRGAASFALSVLAITIFSHRNTSILSVERAIPILFLFQVGPLVG